MCRTFAGAFRITTGSCGRKEPSGNSKPSRANDDVKERPINESVERIQTLRRLARDIREHHEAALHHAATSRNGALEAIKSAILCGLALNDAKRAVGFGQWEGWFAQHCPHISIETARRWMRLAKQSHVTELTTAAGLRQAYIAAGILPPGGSSESSPATKAIGPETIVRWSEWFQKKFPVQSVGDWADEERQRLKAALQPVVDLYHQLA